MMDIQSVSPQRRDNQSGHDLISDLPLGIIHMILALVPTQDAIRTSVLSKQWRNTWATLPQLAFYPNGDKLYADDERLINFINRALMLHKAPIHKFKLSVPRFSDGECPLIDQWLHRLFKNDVRELDLSLGPMDVPSTSSLYSFQKLTHLTLSGFVMDPPPPTFKGFSCLRFLNLEIYGASDTMESLVNSAPLLEELVLDFDRGSLVLRISTPNLKYFSLRGSCEDMCVYAPLVVKMSISFHEIDEDAPVEYESSGCNYVKLLSSCNKLESLEFYNLTKYLAIGIESYHSCLVFHHLKLIELCGVSFIDIKEISVLLHLIMDSPNLQKLGISVSIYEDLALKAGHEVSIWDSKCASGFTFEKLRVVEIIDVRGSPNEMEFINFLLKSSPMLETMTIDHSFELDTEGILKLMSELLLFDRASTTAKIVFKPQPPLLG